MTALDALIDEAYHLFASYEMGDQLAVCTPCCVEPWDAWSLLHLRPQEMPATLIYQYLDAARNEDDTLLIQQMKHLLPRILELLVQGEHLRHSNEIILDKCSCGSALWGAEEIDFLQRFALTYFARQFETYDTAYEAQDVMITFYLAGLDVTPLLEYWLQQIANPMVLWGMVVLIEWCNPDGLYDHAFADEALANKIKAWLAQPELRERVRLEVLDKMDQLIVADQPVWGYERIYEWL